MLRPFCVEERRGEGACVCVKERETLVQANYQANKWNELTITIEFSNNEIEEDFGEQIWIEKKKKKSEFYYKRITDSLEWKQCGGKKKIWGRGREGEDGEKAKKSNFKAVRELPTSVERRKFLFFPPFPSPSHFLHHF